MVVYTRHEYTRMCIRPMTIHFCMCAMAEVWQGVAFCGDGPAGWGAGTQMVCGQDGVELGKNGIFLDIGNIKPIYDPMYVYNYM